MAQSRRFTGKYGTRKGIMPPDPNGNSSDNENGDDPKFVTQDQLSQVVNAAVSNHLKRFESKLSGTIGSAVAEALKAHTPAASGDDPPNDPPADPNAKVDPAMTQMKREMTAMRNKLQKAEDATAAEAKQRKSDALRTTVLKQLGEAGLSGQQLRAAQAVLYQEGRVHVSEDGSHIFRDADGVDLPLSEGMKGWIASDDAKLFLPPKDVRGSGDRAAEGNIPTLKDSSMNQAVSDALDGVRKLRLNQQ